MGIQKGQQYLVETQKKWREKAENFAPVDKSLCIRTTNGLFKNLVVILPLF